MCVCIIYIYIYIYICIYIYIYIYLYTYTHAVARCDVARLGASRDDVKLCRVILLQALGSVPP